MDNPIVMKVLNKYPDVDGASFSWPADLSHWTERDVNVFIGSGGFIRPKKKKELPGAASALIRAKGGAPSAAVQAQLPFSTDPTSLASAAPQPEDSEMTPPREYMEDLFGVRRGRCLECNSCLAYRRYPGIGGG